MTVRLSCALGAAVVALAGPALASPLEDPTAGRAVFTGAATPHATSLLLNPAALALPPGTTGLHIYIAGTATLEQTAVDRREIDLATGELTDGGSVRATEFGPGGTFGLWNVTSSRNLAVGGLIGSPEPSTPMPDGVEALQFHTRGGIHRTTELLTLAAAYRVVDRFYVGGSVSLTRHRVRLAFARDTALEAGRDPARGVGSDCGGTPCGVEHPAAAQLFEVDASPANFVATENLTWRLSTLVEIYPQWYVGATWRLPSFQPVHLTGDARVQAAPRDGGVATRADAAINFELAQSIDVELRARIAPSIDLHVAGRWIDLSAFADYDVRLIGFPADVPEWIERPRGFHDSVRAWAGIEQVDSGQRFLFGVRGGVVLPEIAPSRVSPTTINRWGATADVGVQVRLSRGLIAQLGYGIELRPTFDVTASAYNPINRLECIDSGYDYATAACQRVRDGYAIPTAAGSYRRILHAARLGLRYDFQ